MKIDLRWQMLLAIICLGLVGSLLLFSRPTTGLCTMQVPSSGGKLVEGMVGRPNWINPLLSDVNPVDRELANLIYDGLVQIGEDGELEPALAKSWQISEDGRTYSFELRDDVVWHDGHSFSADDVAFTYGLLQSEDFPAPEAVKSVWRSVIINVADKHRIEFILPQPYSSFLAATTRGVLPAHLLADVPAESIVEHPFFRTPIGTGPFLIVPGNDWQESGFIRLAPNPIFWHGGILLDMLEYRFYEDGQALAEAFSSGEIHAITSLPVDDFEEFATLSGMRLFSAGGSQYTELLFNLTDSAHPAIRNPVVRRALAHALNRSLLVDNTRSGQGLPLEGPYLPTSWAFDPLVPAPIAYLPEEAATLFDAAEWTLSEGSMIRSRGEEPLSFRLLLADSPEERKLASDIIEQWSRVGVAIDMVVVSPEKLPQALSERAFDIALVDVEPGTDPDLYDFWSQEAIRSGQNFGGWNNRRASEALEEARKSQNIDQRKALYDTFLGYFEEDIPALTLFQHVYSYGISEAVNEVEIGRIDVARDRYEKLPLWFLLYREVTSSCPEAVS